MPPFSICPQTYAFTSRGNPAHVLHSNAPPGPYFDSARQALHPSGSGMSIELCLPTDPHNGTTGSAHRGNHSVSKNRRDSCAPSPRLLRTCRPARRNSPSRSTPRQFFRSRSSHAPSSSGIPGEAGSSGIRVVVVATSERSSTGLRSPIPTPPLSFLLLSLGILGMLSEGGIGARGFRPLGFVGFLLGFRWALLGFPIQPARPPTHAPILARCLRLCAALHAPPCRTFAAEGLKPALPRVGVAPYQNIITIHAEQFTRLAHAIGRHVARHLPNPISPQSRPAQSSAAFLLTGVRHHAHPHAKGRLRGRCRQWRAQHGNVGIPPEHGVNVPPRSRLCANHPAMHRRENPATVAARTRPRHAGTDGRAQSEDRHRPTAHQVAALHARREIRTCRQCQASRGGFYLRTECHSPRSAARTPDAIRMGPIRPSTLGTHSCDCLHLYFRQRGQHTRPRVADHAVRHLDHGNSPTPLKALDLARAALKLIGQLRLRQEVARDRSDHLRRGFTFRTHGANRYSGAPFCSTPTPGKQFRNCFP